MITKEQIASFRKEGYLVYENLLTAEEVNYFREVYEDFLDGKIDAQGQRSDLSGTSAPGQQEKIVQIMRPSLLYPVLQNSILHQRALAISQALLG